MRPTVSKKVVMGLAVVLGMATIALLTVYDGLSRVGREMRRLAEVREPSYSATLEIEINLNGIVVAVFAYLKNPEAQYRILMANDESDVAAFHARYLQLSATDAERELGRRLGSMLQEFGSLGRSLMDRRERQEASFSRVAGNLERADATIDRLLHLSARDPLSAPKLAALSDLESELAEVAFGLANYQRAHNPGFKKSISESAGEFRAILGRTNSLRLTAEESQQIGTVARMFERTMTAVDEVLVIEDDIGRETARFLELWTAMDGLLDDQIQPLGLQHLYQPRKAAGLAIADVLQRIQWLLPVVLLVATAVAAYLIRNVIGPLHQLKAGTEAVSRGDLDHRIVVANRDEFGDVAADFNHMVERLRETTVSKEALEQSDLRLRETVKRLRQEIADRTRAEASLRRAETMSAMGSLVAGVAHEVRNPLFGILSVLDAMEARLGERTELQRYFPVLRDEAGRMTRLMQELMEYGRPPNRELAPGPVGEVLSQALRHNESLAAGAGVRLVGRIPNDLPPVRLDRDRLLRVFHNLLENAIQHSQADDEVVLESRVLGTDGQRWIECQVADSGPGFRPDDLPHVFDPFFTRRNGGTGLGLSIVHQIAQEHGGEIAAANRPEGGAVMTVRLPAFTGAAAGGTAEGSDGAA
ncbi:MAG: HAMP domain-containing protein [Gemmatimonadales bacterium]|nr:HAMP domain-containing protein [Gemmatimonadales bacterium]